MLRLPFDLLLSPTQFSSLSAVRMLAYNLYQPFILGVIYILDILGRTKIRTGLTADLHGPTALHLKAPLASTSS
jgi:hypothetical protein